MVLGGVKRKKKTIKKNKLLLKITIWKWDYQEKFDSLFLYIQKVLLKIFILLT